MKQIAQRQTGFSLVEVTIALGVMGVSILSIIGLLPVALNSNRTAFEQTMAANISRAITADLQAAPLTSSTTGQFAIILPGAGQTASTIQSVFFGEDASTLAQSGSSSNASSAPSSSIPPTARYRATVGIFPGALQQRNPTTVRILITWPAFSDASLTSWPKNFAGSFEAMVALNRNN